MQTLGALQHMVTVPNGLRQKLGPLPLAARCSPQWLEVITDVLRAKCGVYLTCFFWLLPLQAFLAASVWGVAAAATNTSSDLLSDDPSKLTENMAPILTLRWTWAGRAN